MVANPSGTFTPRSERLLTISPSEAFLPPTCSRSSSPSSAKGRTLALPVVASFIVLLLDVVLGRFRVFRFCRMIVEISSTDLVEESITGSE